MKNKDKLIEHLELISKAYKENKLEQGHYKKDVIALLLNHYNTTDVPFGIDWYNVLRHYREDKATEDVSVERGLQIQGAMLATGYTYDQLVILEDVWECESTHLEINYIAVLNKLCAWHNCNNKETLEIMEKYT